MKLLTPLQKLAIALIVVLATALTLTFTHKRSFKNGFNAGELAERQKIELAVTKRLEKQKEELESFYKSELEIERKNVKTEIGYVQAKSKIEKLKQEDKSTGLTKEQAKNLNEIFKEFNNE